MSRHINLHVRNKGTLPISTSLDYCQLLDFLPELLCKKSRVDLSCGFYIDLGVSSETQVFIVCENSPQNDPYCMMDVYALDVHEGGKISEGEVFNTARSTFEDAFINSENLTAYYFPNSRSVDERGK